MKPFLCRCELEISDFAGNKAYNNYDAGLSLVETSRTLVKDNEFDGNRWGIRVLAGSNNNTVRK